MKKAMITAFVVASISTIDCYGVCPTLNNVSHLQQGEVIHADNNKWVVAEIDLPKPMTHQIQTHLDMEQKWGNDRLIYCQYTIAPQLSLRAARAHGVIKLFKVPEGRSSSKVDRADSMDLESPNLHDSRDEATESVHESKGEAMEISK